MRYVTYDSDDPIIVTPLPEIGESIRTLPFAINVWNLFWCPPLALMIPIVRRRGAQIRVLVLICWFWSSGLLSSTVDSGIVSTQTIFLDNWCLYLFYLTCSTVKKSQCLNMHKSRRGKGMHPEQNERWSDSSGPILWQAILGIMLFHCLPCRLAWL